jgi:hypothetical protein
MKTISPELQQHFDFLGVNTKTDLKEAKKAYLKLAMKWHPDRFLKENITQPEREYATEQFTQLNTAYHEVEKYLKQYHEQGIQSAQPVHQNYNFHAEEKIISTVRHQHNITLEEFIYGAQALIHIPMELICTTCCGLGQMADSSSFSTKNEKVTDKIMACPECGNVGKVQKTHILSLRIPAQNEQKNLIRKKNGLIISQIDRIYSENYLFEIECFIQPIELPFYQLMKQIHLHVVIPQALFDEKLQQQQAFSLPHPLYFEKAIDRSEKIELFASQVINHNFVLQYELDADYSLNVHVVIDMNQTNNQKNANKKKPQGIFTLFNKIGKNTEKQEKLQKTYFFPHSPLQQLREEQLKPYLYFIT